MVAFIQPSFAKGELSPALYGRVDTSAYQVGLRTARNTIVHAHGGISNRAGSKHIGPSKDHTQTPRLIPFKFNTTDTYILELGNLYMRPIRNDGQVLEPSKTIIGATQANPVVIQTSAAHSFVNGEDVFVDDIVGMTELNGRIFTVANKTADKFELISQFDGTNIDGTGFTAYSSGGTVSRLFTLVTPYVTADLSTLKFTQSADTMTIVHPSYDPRELTRTDHHVWQLAVITFEPEIAFPTGQIVTVNTAGTLTDRYQVTATADETFEESLPATNNTGFTITDATQANPVVIATGIAHSYANGDEVHIKNVLGMTELNDRRFIVANKTPVTLELKGEDGTGHTAYISGGDVNQTFVKVTTSAVTRDNTISWAEVANAQRYTVYKEDNGIFGFLGETETLAFTDDNILPDLSVSPPKLRNPFFGTNNNPGAVSYYEQRRVFGATNNKPDTTFYSQTGSQKNMSTSFPAKADDAITATLNSREVNEIRHFVPGNDLVVLTSGSEWIVNAGSDSGFAADTLRQKPQTDIGSSHLSPIVSGSTILFVQFNLAAVRSFGYSLTLDGYTGTDLSMLANHLFDTCRAKEWAFVRSPDPIVHIVCDDGIAITMTFNQEQEVVAWCHWDTDGKYESVASILPTATDVDEQVYFVVKRTINGVTVRSIERQASRRFIDVRDAFFVDNGKSLDDPIVISGATAADPVVISATAHGFVNGDLVDIADIIWEPTFDAVDNETQPAQLNDLRFKVNNKAANTFEIQNEVTSVDIDGSAFAAYVEGGTVRKAVTTVGGLHHLEAETVAILADGNVVSGTVVTDGQVTLADAASRIHVGMKYISDVETLDIETPNATIQGLLKKISRVNVRFRASRGLFIGPNTDQLTEMKQREFEVYGQPTALLTGDKEIILEPSWNSNGRIFMRQRYPLPMTILAVIPDMEVGD